MRSLNFGSFPRLESIGFCALHVGHQGAVTSIRTGLPAICAASNAFASNVWASNAKADGDTAKLAATKNPFNIKRLSIIFLVPQCQAGDTPEFPQSESVLR